jgi:shikimate dehydrogenase
MTGQLKTHGLRVHTWSNVDPLLAVAGLVINTTPIGMGTDLGSNFGSPLTLPQINLMPQRAIAYDLIYTPRPTQFLKMAMAQGLVAIDGLKMLLHQGAIALEFWTGKPAPIAVMAEALGLSLGI